MRIIVRSIIQWIKKKKKKRFLGKKLKLKGFLIQMHFKVM